MAKKKLEYNTLIQPGEFSGILSHRCIFAAPPLQAMTRTNMLHVDSAIGIHAQIPRNSRVSFAIENPIVRIRSGE